MWKGLEEIERLWAADRVFEPSSGQSPMEANYSGWKKAVGLAQEWAQQSVSP